MKIFAIEFTNYCDAKCSFCPYPTPAHNRKKGFMGRDTLERIIEIIEEPKAINISGLGEPTIHRECVMMICRLVEAGIKVQMNTNGRRIDQDYYDRLVYAGLNNLVITSDYFPWDKGRIVSSAQCPIQLFTITREPDHPELGQVRKPLDDWGGQVGKVERPQVACSFLNDDFVQITWDGKIQRCCVDFNANYDLGDIFQSRVEYLSWKNLAIPLCNGCKGYVFKDGIVAGDYEGTGKVAPSAFVDIKDLK